MQAHHLLDVLVGCTLAVITCRAVDGAVGGTDGVRWQHLATAQAVVLVLAFGMLSVRQPLPQNARDLLPPRPARESS